MILLNNNKLIFSYDDIKHINVFWDACSLIFTFILYLAVKSMNITEE